MTRSHYEVLDVPDWADRDQIHRAYVRLARQAHPDAGGSEARMRELNAAWTVLSDPGRRRAYDRSLGRDRVFVATADGPVRTVPNAAGADADLDDRPLRAPSPRLPIMAVVPVAIFAASVVLYAMGVVFSARHFLAAAVVLFLVASLLMVALPFAQMTAQPAPLSTYLDHILERKRAQAAADRRQTGALVDEALHTDPPIGFAAAINRAAGTGRLAVIAEIKRRSPVRGDLAVDLDAAALAAAYADGGAACLSVLTDVEFFGGSFRDLAEARRGTGGGVPVLRKDFTVSANDVADTRLIGADAVLLISAALDGPELADLHALAGELGLDALVEVHDEPDLDRAMAVSATLVGVNQRDLQTFDVDHDRAARLTDRMPDGVVRVAESGIRGPDDARRLAGAGFHAVLVGEILVRSPDPAKAVAALATTPFSTH